MGMRRGWRWARDLGTRDAGMVESGMEEKLPRISKGEIGLLLYTTFVSSKLPNINTLLGFGVPLLRLSFGASFSCSLLECLEHPVIV